MIPQQFSQQNAIDPIQQYWMRLTLEDQAEFIKLRNQFLATSKIAAKDRRVVAFRHELIITLHYVERSPLNIEERSILTGICFCGPLIAVNNRQFKFFSGRCKSSINGSFQQLGYSAVKTKSKAKACIKDLLPSLTNFPQIIRQWTIRYVTASAPACFVSCPKNLTIPEFTESDLYEDTKTVSVPIYSDSSSSTPYSPEPNISSLYPAHMQQTAHPHFVPQPQNFQQQNFQHNSMQVPQLHPTFAPMQQTTMFYPRPVQQQQIPQPLQQAPQAQTMTQNRTVPMPLDIRSPPHFFVPTVPTLIDEEDSLFDDDFQSQNSAQREQRCELSTSYSVDNFDDEPDDGMFSNFWNVPNVSSIHKSQSAIIHFDMFKDDLFNDIDV